MSRFKPLQEKAYEYLKDKIARGELEYGKFYSETKMASEIGISRTPFKDALVRLMQDRYIDIVPSKTNTYQSRTAVEGFCAFFLHTRRKDPEARAVIRAVERDLELMEQAIRDGAPLSEILDLDLDFHRRIVEFSGNEELIRLYESHKHQLYDIAMKTFELKDRPANAAKEHREILRNLVSDDENAAADTYMSVMKHMDNTKNTVIKLMA